MKTKETEQRDFKLVPNILVSRKKLEWVAFNHTLTEHAKLQIMRRGDIEFSSLSKLILKSPLAWKTFNRCIVVALDLYRYLVIGIPEEGVVEPAKVVTFVDLESSGMNVVDKMLVHYKEFYAEQEKSYSK